MIREVIEMDFTEEQWQAIIDNDATYDKKFYYAVKTTKIFCRPSCPSRPPKKENVTIFQKPSQALRETFRPCKRCKPNKLKLPVEKWISEVCEYIDLNFGDHLTLQVLADWFYMSQYHLQRTFKKIKGESPTEYIQNVRVQKAKAFLTDSDKQVREIAELVGIPNMTYFVTLFKQKTDCTPIEYRRNNYNNGEKD